MLLIQAAIGQIRAICRKSDFCREYAFLRLFCPDFYTDISDLTQILRRHLNKKLAAEASASTLILQGAFGRLDPTGEAARTMMDQIPEVECWK